MVNSISPSEKLREQPAAIETEVFEKSEEDSSPVIDSLETQAERWINEGGHLLP